MAADGLCRRRLYRVVLLVVIFPIFTKGGDDLYSNSYISPNSANNENVHYDESRLPHITSGPSEIQSSKSEFLNTASENDSGHVINVRSIEPTLSRTTGLDDLLSIKNVADQIETNDVELSGRIPQIIQPSKTLKDGRWNEFKHTHLGKSGEAKGAPQGRSVPLLEPREIKPTATIAQNFATLSHRPDRPRQVNPDIQDIITGIVKLLNGKVNVQANTAPGHGRPIRPLSSRINNRGPPRITDVPALPPDFDVPAPLPPPPLDQMTPPISPTKMPTPYPFDIPPHNTSPVRPFPMDKIIPLGNNKRPPLYRPVAIPPWNRPPQRRPLPGRRPIPPHKPLPPRLPEPSISITSEKPSGDIFNLSLGPELESSMEHQFNKNEPEEEISTEILYRPEKIHVVDDGEKYNEENGDKHEEEEYLETPISTEDNLEAITIEVVTESKDEVETSTPELNTTIQIQNENSSSSIEGPSAISPSTVKEEAVSTPLENATLNVGFNETSPTETSTDKPPILESSIREAMQTLKEDLLGFASSKPTDILPMQNTSLSNPSKILETPISTKAATQITKNQTPYIQNYHSYSYRPRPGIVLDDTEYKPGRQPMVTARPQPGQHGDVFDVTVSAIQGPGGHTGQGKPFVIPVDIDSVNLGSNSDVITTAQGDQGFVSIDGRRTYLFGDPTISSQVAITPSRVSSNTVMATGFAVVDLEKKPEGLHNSIKQQKKRPSYGRPSQPPVRIDTCIVGDDSTCGSQHEICRTEAGVSACHCRPGHARIKYRDPCRKIISVLLSLRVDRLYEKRVVWTSDLADKASDSFQQLSFETEKALESAMSMTPFSDQFLGAKVNSIYKGDRAAGQAGVFVNLTLQLEENAETSKPTVRGHIQRELLGVIHRRSNNVGNSALWVDSPPGSISNLQDVDECSSPELHDCHSLAKCINTFGTFKCECHDGYRDPWADNRHRAGRQCEQCSPQYCNNRGECKYQGGHEVCICSGNYYGTQCELDGEVLGVAIGASVAAVIIIGLTLVCLLMWSRRWNKEQKAAVGSPVFGYMATAGNTIKTPAVGAPPYQLTLEDRLRWAQIADAMAQANHYAPEPVTGPNRPSSAVFGYPTLPIHSTLQHGSMHGTLPPVPLPRLGLQAQLAARATSVQGMRQLDNSSSSEEEDKTDLLGRNFQVPRPKSRSNASIANQSGIYYDVDYEQHDIYSKTGTGIPMSTYAIGRPYFRN